MAPLDATHPDGGVEMLWHPDVVLMRHPELVGVVDRWRTGARREVSAADYDTLTAWEIEAVLVMAAAANREEARRLEAQRKARGDA